MRQLGWVEGGNFSYEFRFANGDAKLYAGFARELVAARVDVIAAMNTPAAVAARNATADIPIVMVAEQPVEYGLIESLQRPGGNVTGVSLALLPLIPKRVQILTQAVSGIRRIAYLGVGVERNVEAVRTAANALGVDVIALDARASSDLATAIGQGARADAWLVDDYPLFYPQRSQIFNSIAAQRKAAMYTVPYWVKEGALFAYAQDTDALFSRAAGYVDRILRGRRPSELPVEEPTHFVFVVNLITARSLGLTLPRSILLQATELIQ